MPLVGLAPVSAGIVSDAGVLLIRGADDGIYRYDGRTGTLDRVWRASTFAIETPDGAYAIGRHGGVSLLRWDGATEELRCGTGVAVTVSPSGACASSGLDGVVVRLAGERQPHLTLPADWGASSIALGPDGRRLLVVRTIEARPPGPGMDPGLSALWLMEANGGLRELYRPPGRGVLTAPIWSPDGTKVLVRQFETTSNSFAADGVGVSTIFLDLAKGTSRSLGWTRSETFFPNGRLAFVRGGSRLSWSNKELVVLEANGSEIRRAPAAGAPQVALAPAWGPLGRLAWVSGPATEDYSGDDYIDGLGAGKRVGVIDEGGGTRPVACGEGRVVEGIRWSQDAANLLLLCRKVGREPFPLEIWIHRVGDGTSAPLVRGLASDSAAGGFGFYGTQPAITSVAAWSLAVTRAPAP